MLNFISFVRESLASALIAAGKKMLGEAGEALPSTKSRSRDEEARTKTSPVRKIRTSEPSHPPLAEGDRVAYDPININATFHNGHLYYPIETLVQVAITDSEGRETVCEQTEVVVVRSDRTVHRAQSSPAPSTGNGAAAKVWRLSDGTLIQRPPQANPHSTWSFSSVSNYLAGEGGGYELGPLARSVHQHLYSRVWLPHEEDYWLLTFVAITSYVQSIFDAVPLCLVCGPAGSGKSELGFTVAQVSANAVMIGQTSPATMMRLIDESGGLVVIDDLEAIGGRGKGRKEERFSEIAQTLKVSYKKSTATKAVTDSRMMRTHVLNFFGVKLLNNTTGASGITLGSRMVRVNTHYLPEDAKASFLSRPKISESEIVELRNHLHTWAMSHVDLVHRTYLETVSDKTMREEEISAPLRVLAKIANDKTAIKALELALEKADQTSLDPDEMIELIVQRLVRQGYRSIALQHVLLEMRYAYSLIDNNQGLDWLKIEWVGRRLRHHGIIEEKAVRRRLHGSHLRVAELDEHYLTRLMRQSLDEPLPEKDPFEFCLSCKGCKYASVDCEIAVRRWKTGAPAQ